MSFKVHIQTYAYIIQFFFCVFKTHIVDLIWLIIIKFRLNIFRLLLLSTYFLV